MASFWWEQADLNRRPPACRAGALNQLSYAPQALYRPCEHDFGRYSLIWLHCLKIGFRSTIYDSPACPGYGSLKTLATIPALLPLDTLMFENEIGLIPISPSSARRALRRHPYPLSPCCNAKLRRAMIPINPDTVKCRDLSDLRLLPPIGSGRGRRPWLRRRFWDAP